MGLIETALGLFVAVRRPHRTHFSTGSGITACAPHDGVAIVNEVHNGGEDVSANQEQQRPFENLMPAVDCVK
jgi:hypothetical protein